MLVYSQHTKDVISLSLASSIADGNSTSGPIFFPLYVSFLSTFLQLHPQYLAQNF